MGRVLQRRLSGPMTDMFGNTLPRLWSSPRKVLGCVSHELWDMSNKP